MPSSPAVDTLIASIDGTGRLVLPKKLRDQFNLRAGSRLEVASAGDHLTLRPLDATPALVRENDLWIHRGTATAPLADSVSRLREERSDHLSRGATR